jgi:hypothetical protein
MPTSAQRTHQLISGGLSVGLRDSPLLDDLRTQEVVESKAHDLLDLTASFTEQVQVYIVLRV